MRPVCITAEVPANTRTQIINLLHGPWRVATRLIMVLLCADGMSPAEIADLLDYHPGTVRRWLHRFTTEGLPGLPDRPRSGRPRLGGASLTRRIATLLNTPGPWTIRRLWRRLGRPNLSLRTLWRRTRQVAKWRRPRLVAKHDPDHDRTCATIRRRIAHLRAGAVVVAEDETHLDLLPGVRATWTLRGRRHQVMTPGKNRRCTLFGALDLGSGAWFHLFARRSAVGFIAVLEMLLAAYPTAPTIAVICDNDNIHHAKKVQRWVAKHQRLRLIYGARYSPHDNPVERIWAALKAYLANTAVTWPERIHQARVFFRRRTRPRPWPPQPRGTHHGSPRVTRSTFENRLRRRGHRGLA
jgi:transposase